MDQFWVNMILEYKARFTDIKSAARRRGVKAILDQYLQDGTIDQDRYNEIFNINSEEE